MASHYDLRNKGDENLRVLGELEVPASTAWPLSLGLPGLNLDVYRATHERVRQRS